MNRLQELMTNIRTWSDKAFGESQRALPISFHLKKEVDELIEGLQVGDYKEEFADCFMLLLDAATDCGISADELIDLTYIKLEKNMSRTWGPPDENGVITHIKENKADKEAKMSAKK